ncbi:MAG: hypothetical protein RIF46_13950 [Cyclobacteriaceae bacterium]
MKFRFDIYAQKIAGFIPASHNLRFGEDYYGFKRSRHKAGNLEVRLVAGFIPASYNPNK